MTFLLQTTAPFVEQQTHCAMTATFIMTYKTQTVQLIQKCQTQLLNFLLHSKQIT